MGDSKLLKQVTIILCIFNLIVASYLAGVIFGPLYFGISSGLPGLGVQRGPVSEAKAAEEAPGNTTAALIDAVKQLPLPGPSEEEDDEAVIMTSQTEEGPGEGVEGAPAEARKPRKTPEEMQAIVKAVPAECHPEAHVDYDGFAVQWGLTHLKASPEECCRACQAQRQQAPEGQRKCNVWVYCPQEGGCFSPDIYDHQHQECWLKHAEEPEVNHKGRYPDEFLQEHKTAPEFVDWMAGVL